MAYGRTPFRGRDRKETFRNVLTRQPDFGRGGGQRKPSDFEDLVVRLLAKDPERRLGYACGADEVRAHPFFRGVQWDILAEVARPPFLPDESEAGDEDAAAEGFDVTDYFKKLRQRRAEEATPPPPSSASLDEF